MLSRRMLVRSGGGVNSGLNPPAVNTKLSEPPRSAMSPATSNVPIRERARDASNDTSPVAMSMMPAKSACRSMIASSGSGTAIRNSPMITTATGIREREHYAGGHRDDRDRTAPTELQDRPGQILTQLRREHGRDRREHQVGPGDEIVGDQDVLGAAVADETTQRRRVDRAVEPEDAADRIQREAEEDLDRGRELHRHDDDERQLAVDLLDDAEGLDRELQ